MRPPDDPIFVTIAGLPIYWYGVLILTGILLGAFYASRRAPRRGISPDDIWGGLTLAVLLGMIGARLYHVFSTPAGCTAQVRLCGWPWYQEHPQDIITGIREGGLGIYGAILGGVIGVAIYARYHNISILDLLDLGAPGLALGQAVGRWGNFFNQELYGPPIDSSWFGVYIPPENRLSQFRDLPPDTLFHPTFLYESLWSLALFVVLAVIAWRWEDRLRKGDVFAGYLIGYGIGRFWIEYFRPDAWVLGPLATAQWIGLGLAAFGVAFILYRHRQAPPQETPAEDVPPEEEPVRTHLVQE